MYAWGKGNGLCGISFAGDYDMAHICSADAEPALLWKRCSARAMQLMVTINAAVADALTRQPPASNAGPRRTATDPVARTRSLPPHSPARKVAWLPSGGSGGATAMPYCTTRASAADASRRQAGGSGSSPPPLSESLAARRRLSSNGTASSGGAIGASIAGSGVAGTPPPHAGSCHAGGYYESLARKRAWSAPAAPLTQARMPLSPPAPSAAAVAALLSGQRQSRRGALAAAGNSPASRPSDDCACGLSWLAPSGGGPAASAAAAAAAGAPPSPSSSTFQGQSIASPGSDLTRLTGRKLSFGGHSASLASGASQGGGPPSPRYMLSLNLPPIGYNSFRGRLDSIEAENSGLFRQKPASPDKPVTPMVELALRPGAESRYASLRCVLHACRRLWMTLGNSERPAFVAQCYMDRSQLFMHGSS